MPKPAKPPSRKRLRELFEYCPESGQLLWREARGPRAPKGGVAGFLASNGAWKVSIEGRLFSAHSLVWKYCKGRNPKGPLVHLNGHRDDNRIENLRPLKGARGPYTLDMIRDKCEITGECWHWMAGKSGKAPALRHEGKILNVRRYIFTELLGREVTPGRMVTMICESLDCVAPDHLVQNTRRQLQQKTARRTNYGKNPMRSAKLSAAKRAASPYSDEFVEQVRAMEGSAKAIARQLGLCASTVNEWRKMLVRKPATNNPFAGLLAA